MTRQFLLITSFAAACLGVAGVAPGQDPDSLPSPRTEARLFEKRSAEVWEVVLKEFARLGLPADQTDKKNQVILTQWRRPGSKGLEWLPSPRLPEPYVVDRVRFEVFVSPFAEPARVYVGSIVEGGYGTVQSTTYNDTSLNRALIAVIAKLVGQDGVPVPLDWGKRRELALAFLGDKADDCMREVPPRLVDKQGKLTPPRKIRLSVLRVLYPAPALEERVQGRVTTEFLVQEDGAVVGVRSAGPRLGRQLETAALGAASLLLYVPPEVNGCRFPAMVTYTVNFQRR